MGQKEAKSPTFGYPTTPNSSLMTACTHSARNFGFIFDEKPSFFSDQISFV